MKCPKCGMKMESPALRCPRCLEPISLGCSGDCNSCGKDGEGC